MKKLTLDDVLNFPKTTYARGLGKSLTNQIVSELLVYKVWEERLGVPLEVLAQLIHQNCYYDGKEFHELGLQFINQDGDCGIIVNLQQWENTGEPFYLKDYKNKFTLGLDDPFIIKAMFTTEEIRDEK